MKPSPHRDTDLYFDKVIIGTTIQAMVTAYKYQIPIFVDERHKPLPNYHLPYSLDLSGIQVENKTKEYTLLSGKKEKRGMQRLELWNIMAYRLGIMGLMPMYGFYKNTFTDPVPINNNIRMFAVGTDNKVVNVYSSKTVLFDYPKHTFGKKVYMVNDYIELDKIYNFEADMFTSKDCDFLDTLNCETIFFKDKGRKHTVCAKSIITQENIDTWRYSQTAVRLKVQNSIFWNMEKNFNLMLGKREISPIMNRMEDSLEHIIDYDIMDSEIHE
ncbi:MAG TPA: hypothetical protein DCM40_19480 [Maribacter sp.]|nr:hypothetical protein [Maribacter sp.]